jgi:hypothetical protein
MSLEEMRAQTPKRTQPIIKPTKGAFGFALEPHVAPCDPYVSLCAATPAEYVERVQAQNEVFGDDSRIIGVSKAYNDNVGLVVSQKAIKGGEPSPAALEDYMQAHGFVKVNSEAIDNKYLSDKTWFHPASGYVVTDVTPDNFKQDAKGHIHAIDVIVQHAPPGGDLHTAMVFGTSGRVARGRSTRTTG